MTRREVKHIVREAKRHGYGAWDDHRESEFFAYLEKRGVSVRAYYLRYVVPRTLGLLVGMVCLVAACWLLSDWLTGRGLWESPSYRATLKSWEARA